MADIITKPNLLTDYEDDNPAKGLIASEYNKHTDATNKTIDVVNSMSTAIVAEGTGNAIELTIPGITAYTPYMKITFISTVSNGGLATTININGLGAIPFNKNLDGSGTPTINQLRAYTICINGEGTWAFLQASAEGDAVAEHVLAGKTFSNDNDTGLIGTMVNKSGVDQAASNYELLSDGTLKFIPVAGYYDETSRLRRQDTDLVVGNIKAGVNIFGAVGTFTSDANAVAANILSGKTAYVNGDKITGNMPNRAGDTAALASSVSGTTLKLRASNGYRDGVDDNVTITDADFIANNIRNGVNIFGITGNLNEGMGISSIQRGFIALSQATTSIVISAVDVSKSIVRATLKTSRGYLSVNVRARFIDSTHIELSCAHYYSFMAVSWEVITFNNANSIQSGLASIPNDSLSTATYNTDITISTININKSIVFITYKITEDNGSDLYNCNFAYALTDTTKLSFGVHGIGVDVAWFVVELK